MLGILATAIDLYLSFFIFLRVLYKFFAASLKFPFLDKKYYVGFIFFFFLISKYASLFLTFLTFNLKGIPGE